MGQDHGKTKKARRGTSASPAPDAWRIPRRPTGARDLQKEAAEKNGKGVEGMGLTVPAPVNGLAGIKTM